MVDIYFHGQACFRVKGKSSSVVIDPYSSEFTGLKPLKAEADIVCISHDHKDHSEASVINGVDGKEPFVIAGPGEYEIGGVNIVGVSSFHDDKNGEERGKNTIYQVLIDELSIVHLGDLGQKKLTQDQVEILSACDVLMIPVGGVYTIDAKEALDIIAQLEPKIIIPMHYKLSGLKFDLADVSDFLKGMGKEQIEQQAKYSVSRDRLPEEVEVAVLLPQ